MFDKWFAQDIAEVLDHHNRVVVIDESDHLDLLKKVLPAGLGTIIVTSALEELECKYNIEKTHQNDKMVILTTTARNKLTFIRDYCETCGCVEIHTLETYISTKVFDRLGLNITLSNDELKAAVHNSIGKGEEYWDVLCRKGGERIFDIGADILGFLDNPEKYCISRDKEELTAFFKKTALWLGKDYIEQPPKTLAKEVADKILGSLLDKEPEKKYLAVYNKWIDSKTYEKSLEAYSRDAQYSATNLWEVFPSHSLEKIDSEWVEDLSKHLGQKDFIAAKLPLIRLRSGTAYGKKWRNGLWGRIRHLLECDTTKCKSIASLDDATRYYTSELFKVDTAIRIIYEEFWGNKEIIRPFQEYYNQLMTPFLYKWFQYFDSYAENQKGLLADKILNAPGKVAIIVGDGIAYEVAQNVSLKMPEGIKVDNQYRMSGIPSVTENNMSLLYQKNGVVESVHGRREAYLKGQVQKNMVFVALDDVNFQHMDADVLVCSCKDIDDIAEKMQHKALKFFGSIENTLAEKIQFLLNNGFAEVLLTSDHGFVLTGLLSESDKVELKCTGEASKAERYIRTVEKQNSGDLIEYAQSYGDYRFVYFSKNMKPFKSTGTYGYAHGGLSPQELLIPYVTFSLQTQVIQELEISIDNGKLLQGIVGDYFSIHLKASEGSGDIFTQNRKVMLLFIDGGKPYNTSDIVSLKAGELVKKDFSFDGHRNIEVIVVDAGTKQRLATVTVSQTVARDLGGLL